MNISAFDLEERQELRLAIRAIAMEQATSPAGRAVLQRAYEKLAVFDGADSRSIIPPIGVPHISAADASDLIATEAALLRRAACDLGDRHAALVSRAA